MLPYPDSVPPVSALIQPRSQRLSLSRGLTMVAAVVAITVCACPLSAQQASVPVPAPAPRTGSVVWNLSPGDMFRVAIASTRTTTITVNGQTLPPQKSTDILQLEYQLRVVVPDGDAIFQVRILAAELGPGTPEANSIGARSEVIAEAAQRKLQQLPPVSLQVSPEGTINMSSEYHRSLLEKLAANDAASFALLRKSSPREICSSWFGRPFWFPTRDLLLDAKAPWTTSCTDSCGPFGTLQTEITLERLPIEDGVARCQLTGTPRFVPLVLPAKDAADAPLPITDLTIESAEFSGTAWLRLETSVLNNAPPPPRAPLPGVDPDPRSAGPRARPPFQSLDTLLKISGRGTPSENLRNQLKADQFQFDFTHQSRVIITGYAFRGTVAPQPLPR
ncbi:MAG: hypothetical protein ACKO2P_07395 [Planctomycetota bacterium]